MEILIIAGTSVIIFLLSDFLWGYFRINFETVDVDGNFNCKDGCGYWCTFSNYRNHCKFGMITFSMVRRFLKKPPIWILPPPIRTIGRVKIEITREEIGFIVKTNQICIEIKNNLKINPISLAKKADIYKHIFEIPFNLEAIIWELYQIRRIRVLIQDNADSVVKNEVYELEKKSLSSLREIYRGSAKVLVWLMEAEMEDRLTIMNKFLPELKKMDEELGNLAISIETKTGDYKMLEEVDVPFQNNRAYVMNDINHLNKPGEHDLFADTGTQSTEAGVPKKNKNWLLTFWGVIVAIGVILGIISAIIAIVQLL